MSTHQHRRLTVLEEMEDVLETYAEWRLSPTTPVLARIRRAVLAEAAASDAARLLERRPLSEADPPRPRFTLPLTLPQVRIPAAAFALGFSVILGAGTGAAVLAAPPGSPFFNARIALEQILLPVDIDARLAAHEHHLAARLAEAEAAAARGDTAGLIAALAAYDAEVDAALAELGNDADQLAHLEAMLAKHVAVLTSLEARVPEQASVDKALEHSQKAIVNIQEKAKAGKPSHAPGGRPSLAPGGPANERPGGRP